MRKDDYQVVEIDSIELPFQLYRWDGKAWRYQRKSFATTEEELAFVAECGLALLKEGTLGVWPMRVYRAK